MSQNARIEVGTIVAYRDDYGYVVEIDGDKAVILYPRLAPQRITEKIANFNGSKWPLRVVPDQKASPRDIRRALMIFHEFEHMDAIFRHEVESLKTNPDYKHLLTDEDELKGDDTLAMVNIQRHLMKHFPEAKGLFHVSQLPPYDTIQVTWHNTVKCKIRRDEVEPLLRPFEWGVTDKEGRYLELRNPFAKVFGGVYFVELYPPVLIPD